MDELTRKHIDLQQVRLGRVNEKIIGYKENKLIIK